MNGQIKVLREELVLSITERTRLEAELYAARVGKENAELVLRLKDNELRMAAKQRDERFTGGQVFRIAAGSVAITALVTVLVLHRFD